MNIKAALKYRLYDSKKPILIYYLAIAGLLLLLFTSFMSIKISSGRVNGMEMASAIFLFVFGMNSFKESFRLFMQNGVSRKTVFVSQLLSALIICATMSLIDNIISFLNKIIFTSDRFSYTGLIEQIYGKQGSGISMAILSFGFCFSLNLAFLSLGFLITTLYYRMNKGQKIAVSIGVPALLYVILPVLDTILFKKALSDAFGKLFSFAFGSPFASILSCIILSTVFYCFCWPLIKKAVVRD